MMVNPTQRVTFHETCFACGKDNAHGLNLDFVHTAAVSMCTISIPVAFQSYDGVTHGGIVATLMDAAMVRCLHNKFGGDPFTCKLEVRYKMNIPPGQPITLTASFQRRRGDVCWATAQILCKGSSCASAEGAFKLQRLLR